MSQPMRKHRCAKILQPTRECRFATLLLCSLHASAGLHLGSLQPHTVRVSSLVAMQPTHARVCHCVMSQPTRKCRFATLLSCSPHASAGLHPRCPAAHTLQPHHIAAHTQAQVCNLVIMLSTRKCGFASVLPCIPHASAGSQACRHAAHKQVRACTHVVLQPTRMCRCATSCHAAHTQVRVCALASPLAAHM